MSNPVTPTKDTCSNCHTKFIGPYCYACGQKAGQHRIDLHFLLHEIQHGVFHVDKGIFYTIKELFTRPGHSIREFLDGKRVKHFKPVALLLLLAGIYGFLSHYFQLNLLANNVRVSGNGEESEQLRNSVQQMSEWMSTHYSLVALIKIPLFSLGTYIGLKWMRLNFIEHLVIQLFLGSQRLVLQLLMFPVFIAMKDPVLLFNCSRWTDIFGYLIMAVSIGQLMGAVKLSKKFVSIIISFIISFILLFIVLLSVFNFLLLK